MKVRIEYKIIMFGLLFAVLSWLADIVIDKIEFPDQPIIHIILYDAPSHIVLIRPTIALLIIAFGILIAFYVKRIEKLETRCHAIFDNVNEIILVGCTITGKVNDANQIAMQKLGYTKEELLQLKLADLLAPENLSEYLAAKESLPPGQHVVLETTLVGKDGRNIPVEMDSYEVNLVGEVVNLAIISDISGRLERQKEIRRLASIPQFNPNPILEIDASGQVTYYNDAAAKMLQKLAVTEGPDIFLPHWDQVMEEISRHRNRQLCREVKIKNAVFAEYIHFVPGLEVVRLYAIDITARMRGEDALRKAKDELENKVKERTGELMVAYETLQHEMVERQQAEQAVRESAQQLRTLAYQLLNAEENERRLISMTLHDELGQDLIFLKYMIDPLAKKLQKDKQAQNKLDAISQKLNEVIEKVRQISRYLSPTILEEVGFSAAIKNMFEEFCEHFNCPCKFYDKMEEIGDSASPPHGCQLLEAEVADDLLSRQAQINIYRILQESLTNISKHSQATRVFVGIKKQDEYFSLTVEDNGKGFDVQKTMAAGSLHKGMGLISMQERVRMLGGSFNIESREGAGTKISVLIPIDQGGE